MNANPLTSDPNVPISDEILLTAEQVAQILQVKPQTIRDAAWRGKRPCVKLWAGKRKSLLRFKRSEIRELIHDRSVPARNLSDGRPANPRRKQ